MKNETHMMIDLETLDTKASAVVLSAGVAVFTKDAVLDKRHLLLDVDKQLKSGRTVSFSTLCWWMRQSYVAKGGVFNSGCADMKELRWLIIMLNDVFEMHGCKYVWSHGASFDIPILENIEEQVEISLPWAFWNVRDTRTFFDTLPNSKTSRQGVYHNALDDAVHQASCVMKGLREL